MICAHMADRMRLCCSLLGYAYNISRIKIQMRLDSISYFIFGPGHAKMCLMPYANNKGADQPAHPRNLISAFVVRSLDSIISLVSRSEISRF